MKAVHYSTSSSRASAGRTSADTARCGSRAPSGPDAGLGAEGRDRRDARVRRRLLRRARGGGSGHAARPPGRRIAPDVLVAGPPSARAATATPAGLSPRAAASTASPRWRPCTRRTRAWTRPGKAYIVPTAVNVAGMRDALPRLARLAAALADGRELGSARGRGLSAARPPPQLLRREDGSGARHRPSARKLAGDTRTEVGGGLDRVEPPAAPFRTLSGLLLALVTEAGCVRRGIPTAFRPFEPRGGSGTTSTARTRWPRRATSPSTAASTHLANEIRTGWFRWTRCGSSSARAASAACTRPCTRRPAMGRPSSRRRVSGGDRRGAA